MLGVAVLIGLVLLAGSSGRGEPETAEDEETAAERYTADVEQRAVEAEAGRPPRASVGLGMELAVAGAGTGAVAFTAIGGAALGPVGAAVGAFVGWALMLGTEMFREQIGDVYRDAVRDALRDRGLRGTQTEVDEGIIYLMLVNYPGELAYDPRTGQPGLVWQTRRTRDYGIPGIGVTSEAGELGLHPGMFLSRAYRSGAVRHARQTGLSERFNTQYDSHPLGTVLMGQVRAQGSPGEFLKGVGMLWTKNHRLEFTPGRRTPPRTRDDPDDPIRLGGSWRVLRPGDGAGLAAVMAWWAAHRG